MASVLDSWQVFDRRADILLLLSELVNNAVHHCQSGVEVTVAQLASAIRVEVFDDGAGQPPVLREVDARGEHGRGLHLVDAIADVWGYREVSPRKAVWFDVSV